VASDLYYILVALVRYDQPSLLDSSIHETVKLIFKVDALLSHSKVDFAVSIAYSVSTAHVYSPNSTMSTPAPADAAEHFGLAASPPPSTADIEKNVPRTSERTGIPSVLPSPSRRVCTWRVAIMTVLVSLGGMIFGYGGIGQIGGFLAMADYQGRFGDVVKDGKPALSTTRTGMIVGMLMIGALVSSLGAGMLADKIGRKKSISLWALTYLVGSVIEITTTNAWYQIVIGRFTEGLGIGGLSILVPVGESLSRSILYQPERKLIRSPPRCTKAKPAPKKSAAL
jgi:hypothetical protein